VSRRLRSPTASYPSNHAPTSWGRCWHTHNDMAIKHRAERATMSGHTAHALLAAPPSRNASSCLYHGCSGVVVLSAFSVSLKRHSPETVHELVCNASLWIEVGVRSFRFDLFGVREFWVLKKWGPKFKKNNRNRTWIDRLYRFGLFGPPNYQIFHRYPCHLSKLYGRNSNSQLISSLWI
jgi:hypothetical protein